ncbi:unnamed protein product, partial [Allacma fusca]
KGLQLCYPFCPATLSPFLRSLLVVFERPRMKVNMMDGGKIDLDKYSPSDNCNSSTQLTQHQSHSFAQSSSPTGDER